MPYLEETHIRIHHAESIPFLVDKEVSAGRLFTAISSSKSLYLAIDLPDMVFLTGTIFHIPFETLNYLKYRSCEDNREGSWLLKFLHCTPNLKKLTLVKVKRMTLTPDQVPLCLLCSIEEIKITFYMTKIAEQLRVASYLLKHGLHLQKFIVNLPVEQTDQSRVIEELLCLGRGSDKCQLSIV
ncbi:hypothetical protein V6N13_123343 [Hibiscus sabdariffa]|uniref:FBD domain-containing protein n=1 Tax=Hibiscus sabdariffa TaxID=183260 RepID=A0ABR2AZV1_9ROSI